ncbi:MAG: AI-2E family transporter [Nostocaceae cyanobacterium]|nr:AI-2E family transporter [Nostocaceae cyanobacterium]
MNISLTKLLQLLITTLLFPLLFLNAWLGFKVFQYFQPLITTFVLSSLLAFILNYPVTVLSKRGIQRGYAVGIVFVSTLIIVLGFGITVIPIVLEQFNQMIHQLPQWIESSEQKLQNLNIWLDNQRIPIDLSHVTNQLTDKLPDEVKYFGDKFFQLIIDTLDSISEALITIVLTFYLLVDGKRIWQGLFKKLPSSFGKLETDIQQNFQNYLIGQVALALLMGLSLTVVFLFFQVPFGLLFGLSAGLLSLIPFGDVVSLVLITLIIATHDFWLATKVLATSVVIDQLIDQAIAPRLLGKFTGLRPIWVLISLLLGTYVGGLLGLVIAVPVAGVIKDVADGYSQNAITGEELPELLSKE